MQKNDRAGTRLDTAGTNKSGPSILVGLSGSGRVGLGERFHANTMESGKVVPHVTRFPFAPSPPIARNPIDHIDRFAPKEGPQVIRGYGHQTRPGGPGGPGDMGGDETIPGLE